MVEVLRAALHFGGVWRDIMSVGDIQALGGVNAPRRIKDLGAGAVRWAVRRGGIVVWRLIHG